jgi:hypothetical protein
MVKSLHIMIHANVLRFGRNCCEKTPYHPIQVSCKPSSSSCQAARPGVQADTGTTRTGQTRAKRAIFKMLCKRGDALDVGGIKHGRVGVAQVDDAPNVGCKPQVGVLVWLVLADQDGMRHWKKAHHGCRLPHIP